MFSCPFLATYFEYNFSKANNIIFFATNPR